MCDFKSQNTKNDLKSHDLKLHPTHQIKFCSQLNKFQTYVPQFIYNDQDVDMGPIKKTPNKSHAFLCQHTSHIRKK